jgi:hypothetical protein
LEDLPELLVQGLLLLVGQISYDLGVGEKREAMNGWMRVVINRKIVNMR